MRGSYQRFLGAGLGEGLIREGHEGAFDGDENVLHLGCWLWWFVAVYIHLPGLTELFT